MNKLQMNPANSWQILKIIQKDHGEPSRWIGQKGTRRVSLKSCQCQKIDKMRKSRGRRRCNIIKVQEMIRLMQ